MSSITRWNPITLSPMRDLFNRDEFNRLFDGFLDRIPGVGNGGAFNPPVDVEETPEEFLFKFDLPGVSQKDVKVSLMGDTLTIRGERREENEKREGNLHRTERVYGSFERSFKLGMQLRADKVKAQYRDGVLEIRVPKAEEAKPREVEIQLGS